MYVNVDLAKIFRIRAELAVAAAHEAQSGLHRFLHYFTDVTGQCDVTFAGITHRLDMQDFAAGGRVSQSSDNAWLTRFEFCLANILGRTKQFGHSLWCNRNAFLLPARDLRRHRPANRADLPLEFANPG